MNPVLALMRREWLQHRRSWLLLAGIPIVALALLVSIADVRLDTGTPPDPLVVAAVAVLACAGLLFLLFLVAGLTTIVGLARRDHADRSVEFWLSLPVSHLRSLLMPCAVHLLALPLAGAALGAVAGLCLAPVLLARVAAPADVQAVPWGSLAGATALGIARLTVGWPLALLWLSPLIVIPMVAFAWARRWGLFLLGVAVVLAQSPLAPAVGLGWLAPVLGRLASGAASSVVSGGRLVASSPEGASRLGEVLAGASAWWWADVGRSLQQLASPTLLGALLTSAAGIAALVHWRRRGAPSTV